MTAERLGSIASELDQYQRALPVRLIATPRAEFVVCRAAEPLGLVRQRVSRDAFDHLPVVDDAGRITAVLDVRAHNATADEASVGSCCTAVAEEFLIGAEVSILDFVRDADRRPFRFLVTGEGISGLVSLSDIQRVPVRAALFAMITRFEMSATQLVAARYPGGAWLARITPGRREKIRAELERARVDKNQVDPLLYTQLADKTRLLIAVANEQGSVRGRSSLSREFRRIEMLRNALAHSNTLGVTHSEACEVVCTVRAIAWWNEWMQEAMLRIGSDTE